MGRWFRWVKGNLWVALLSYALTTVLQRWWRIGLRLKRPRPSDCVRKTFVKSCSLKIKTGIEEGDEEDEDTVRSLIKGVTFFLARCSSCSALRLHIFEWYFIMVHDIFRIRFVLCCTALSVLVLLIWTALFVSAFVHSRRSIQSQAVEWGYWYIIIMGVIKYKNTNIRIWHWRARSRLYRSRF